MENKKVIPTWLSVIFTLLCVGALAYYVYQVYLIAPFGFSLSLLVIIILIATNCVALVYACNGYKKDASIYFLLTAIGIAIVTACSLYMYAPYIYESTYILIDFTTALIGFAVAAIFAVAKNLGKKKSYVLCSFFLLALIIDVVISIPLGWLTVVIYLASAVHRILFCIMVYAKYRDKDARGTN